MTYCLKTLFGLVLIFFANAAFAENTQPKIISIGGSITEIIYALDEQDRLIARDTTSTYPPAATDLPDIGYIRQLSPEGVLSVEPNIIISLEGAGPPETIDVLRQSSVKFIEIPETYSREGIINKIIAVGAALEVPDRAALLADKTRAELTGALQRGQFNGDKKKVLFILSLRGGKITVAGTNTAADAIIRMAGAKNAISGFSGYKTLTDEAAILAAPDVILMMDRRGNHSADNSAVFSHPTLRLTSASLHKNIIQMDGMYLLGFGLRTASAIKELSQAIYGEIVVQGQ